MDARYSFDNISLEAFNDMLKDYQGVVPSKLIDLDKARYETIPTGLETTTDDRPALTQAEVVTLVEWKLSHGTFRPTLKALVNQNDEDTIANITAKAFEHFTKDPKSNIKLALAELTKLKGIGPATASLLLSAYDPIQAPFFSDELFRWSHWEVGKANGWDRKIKYTPKEYLDLFEKVQALRERLDVTAVEAEKVAYVLGKRGTERERAPDSSRSAVAQPELSAGAKGRPTTEIEKAAEPVKKRAKTRSTESYDLATASARVTRSSARVKADGKK